jgi:predicted ATPase
MSCVCSEILGFPDQTIVAPELIAKHLERAERPVEAIERWEEAGDPAMRRSATTEALAHFARALELVASLPDTRSRSERELAVLLRLGLASQVANGPASPKTGEYYEHAVERSRALGESRQEFMAAWGLWLHFNVQGLVKGTRSSTRAISTMLISKWKAIMPIFRCFG